MENSFFDRLQSIDRRWLYLILGVTLMGSLIYGKWRNAQVTPVVTRPVQLLFDAVDAAPAGPGDGKLILVGMTFSAGTMGENANQARAIIRHLMLRQKRFAIVSIREPQGAQYSLMMTKDLAAQYGYEYGTDWISFGYQLGPATKYKQIVKDLQGAMKIDGMFSKPLNTYPIMQGITTANDLAMHIEVSASDSVDYWYSIVQPSTEPRLKIGYACTGVMASQAYPLLDSGQIVGVLPGLKGAADYEFLVDQLQDKMVAAGTAQPFNASATPSLPLPDPARRLMLTQGTAHVAILFFIFMGNLGIAIAWIMKRVQPRTEDNNHG